MYWAVFADSEIARRHKERPPKSRFVKMNELAGYTGTVWEEDTKGNKLNYEPYSSFPCSLTLALPPSYLRTVYILIHTIQAV
jgi:hypothetical protein